MARYTGPKTKKSRAFGQPIYGYDKFYERRKYPPGHHGGGRRRRQKSDYALQLMEKQKAKYTYGVLERQFRNLFHEAASARGVTGEVLLQLLESRLDNTVFRLGIAPTRRAARQLVTHKHIVLIAALTAQLAGREKDAQSWLATARKSDPDLNAEVFFRSFPFGQTHGRELIERSFSQLGV